MIRTLLNGSAWTLTGGGHACPAIVPGSVHDALVAAEVIPDPDANPALLRRVESKDVQKVEKQIRKDHGLPETGSPH